MKYYRIIDSNGYVLSNKYDKACEIVLGYGGVWTKDLRKAKRFNSVKMAQKEVNRMPYSSKTKFLVVSNEENAHKEFMKYKKRGLL